MRGKTVQNRRLAWVSLCMAISAQFLIAPALAHAAPLCAGQVATIVGTPAVVDVVGTAGRDVIVGSGANNIQGLGGNDLICAGGQLDVNDTIDGGAGNDVIHGGFDVNGGSGNDQITGTFYGSVDGGDGNDRIINRGDFASAIAGGNGNDYIETGGGLGGANGGAGNDVLISSGGLNTNGGPGDDVVIGRGGSGNLLGGDGNDVVMAPRTGNGYIFWDGPGNDVYLGNDNPKTLVNYYYSPASVTINLKGGFAVGWGADTLMGVHSAAGSVNNADVIIGDDRPNILRGIVDWYDANTDPTAAGADVMRGGRGNDDIAAYGFGSRAFGDGGNDTVAVSGSGNGGPGNDVLTGYYDSNDTLVGGAGLDHADGSDGTDTCSAEVLLSCEIIVP